MNKRTESMMTLMKTLILTENDIRRLLSMEEVMEAVELAFAEKGMNRVQMTPKGFLVYPKYNGDARAMLSYLEGLDISAVEITNVHENNRSKFRLPTMISTVVMLEPKNGAAIAIMGGTHISNMSSAVAGAIAAKHLARKDSKIVGLIGAGAQAKAQLAALLALYSSLDEVRVWSRTKQTREEFLEHFKKETGKRIARIIPMERPEDSVRGADIVATTTSSRVPVVLNDWVQPGMHFNCVGADAAGKQEMDPAALKRAKIVVDDLGQASVSGEINVPLTQGLLKQEDVFGSIGEIIAGLKQGRKSDDEITVFTSTGLALQTAVAANIAYKKAMAHGMGQMVELW
jgi:alanine dehydrogenase